MSAPPFADLVRRALYAEAERGVLYVTDAELVQLKAAFPAPPDDRQWIPAHGPGEPVTAYPTFWGVRLAVDDAEAAEQDSAAKAIRPGAVFPMEVLDPASVDRLRARIVAQRIMGRFQLP